ncbi:MAG: Fic family protein [Defluviitaleaceae bacterium]|nr:Fic family protein [Defluviitaleaceae bacterium]
MRRLSIEDLCDINHTILRRENTLRDETMLDSCINSAYQSYGGEDFFVTDFEKICRISYGIVKNRTFVDGNKRTALCFLAVWLNFIELDLKNTLLVEPVILMTAQSLISFEDFCHMVRDLLEQSLERSNHELQNQPTI